MPKLHRFIHCDSKNKEAILSSLKMDPFVSSYFFFLLEMIIRSMLGLSF